MDGAELAEAVQDVAVAVSKQENRPALTGIRFQVHPQSGTLSLVATDGYRLAVREAPIEQTGISDDMESFLLAGAPLKKWASFKPEGTVVIQLGRDAEANVRHVAFRTRSVSTAFWVMDAKFPEYMGVYTGAATKPKVASFRADSKELMKALNTLKPVVPMKNPTAAVVMRVDGTIDPSFSGSLGEAAVSLDGEIQKDDRKEEVKVGVRWAYLADAVKRAAKWKLPVEVQISDPAQPIYARFGEDYDYLLMPIRLQ